MKLLAAENVLREISDDEPPGRLTAFERSTASSGA